MLKKRSNLTKSLIAERLIEDEKDVPGFKNRNLIAERLIEGEFMSKYDLLRNLLPTLQCPPNLLRELPLVSRILPLVSRILLLDSMTKNESRC